MTICKNCGHPVDLKFCPSCGQKASVKRLEMKSLLKELPHAVWHLDRGILYNLFEIFKRPGYSIKEYLDGKRKRYYHPLFFLLIVMAVIYVLMQFLKVHYYDPVQDAGMSESNKAFWIAYDASAQAWTNLYKWYIPFVLPWMSLIYWAWLRIMKMKYTYAECIVITFFSASQMIIPQIPVLVIVWIVNNTAFTRIFDYVLNWGIIVLIYFFQFYQLGNSGLKNSLRIIYSTAGAFLMMGFASMASYTFLQLVKVIGS